MSNVAPGWYDDGSGRQRWWDGQQWTDHVPVQPAPVYMVQAPRRPTNGVAIAGFVLSLVALGLLILAPFVAFIGLIFSLVGFNESRRTGAGRSLAIWGICLSAIPLLYVAVSAIYSILIQ